MSILENINDQITRRFSLDQCLFYCSIPVDKHQVKKNGRPIMFNKRTKRHFLGKDQNLRVNEDYLTTMMIKAKHEYSIGSPIQEPVWVIFHFYFSNYFTKKNEVNKKLPDLSNLYQMPEDCLEAAGVLENDNLIESHDLSRRLSGPEDKLDVFILRHHRN